MARLTYRNSDGAFGVEGIEMNSVAGIIHAIIKRLTEYEDTAHSPDELVKLMVEFKEYKDAEQEGHLIKSHFKPGEPVWILEYDEDGKAVDYAGYIILMCNADFAVLSMKINGMSDVFGICNHYYDDYIEYDSEARVLIIPLEELYTSREDAKAALEVRQK